MEGPRMLPDFECKFTGLDADPPNFNFAWPGIEFGEQTGNLHIYPKTEKEVVRLGLRWGDLESTPLSAACSRS